MRAFIKLFALLMALFGGVVMLIKLLYGSTWGGTSCSFMSQ